MSSGARPADDRLIDLAAKLASADDRTAAATELAGEFGASALLMFLRDREIGALLSAPGFPQTLPNGRAWKAFLAECAKQGSHAGELPLVSADQMLPACGFAVGGDVVCVLLGTSSPTRDVNSLQELLPFFAAVFRAEQEAMLARTRARLAAESAERAATLTRALDHARREIEDALAAARSARTELERAHANLQDQAAQLETANEELRAKSDEVEAQGEELQATNQELDSARSIAENANRAKSEFLATMSHELRTPLNAIGGYVQLIMMGIHGPVTEDQKQSLSRIERNQVHLLGLINNILNLSRIEAGRVDYDIKNVSLSEALGDLWPMIEPQLAAKNLTYEVTNATALPFVCADREKLQQILLNLFSNSVKFTDSGGRISVGLGSTTTAGKVDLRVTDTGQGIPADKLEVIFDPFTQVDATHTRAGEGTGLGLAISRDLARGMGGDLRVRSKMGSGSCFILTLNAGDGPG